MEKLWIFVDQNKWKNRLREFFELTFITALKSKNEIGRSKVTVILEKKKYFN